jgi:hypothetical protein
MNRNIERLQRRITRMKGNKNHTKSKSSVNTLILKFFQECPKTVAVTEPILQIKPKKLHTEHLQANNRWSSQRTIDVCAPFCRTSSKACQRIM